MQTCRSKPCSTCFPLSPGWLCPCPQHVHSAVDVRGPWVGCPRWVGAGGSGRTRPAPAHPLWRGRFCLCTFASFVMKHNKNPMFSSLPPLLFSCPFPYTGDGTWASRYIKWEPHTGPPPHTHTHTHTPTRTWTPRCEPLTPTPSQLVGPIAWKGRDPRILGAGTQWWGSSPVTSSG